MKRAIIILQGSLNLGRQNQDDARAQRQGLRPSPHLFPGRYKEGMRKGGGEAFVCFTPDEGRERLYPVFGRGEYYISQRGSGLGERMYQAVREVLGRGMTHASSWEPMYLK